VAGSPAAKSASKLIVAAPDASIEESGRYLMPALEIVEELESVSPEANRLIGNLVVGVEPFSRSKPGPLNMAGLTGYCLRAEASRRGVPLPPAEQLGADLVPRSASGQPDFDAFHADDQAMLDARIEVWDKMEALAGNPEAFGYEGPMWRFVAASVVNVADDQGKISRHVSFDDMIRLIGFGHAVGMLDEALGWDLTKPAEAQTAGGSAPA
jgi:hypothetical protein